MNSTETVEQERSGMSSEISRPKVILAISALFFLLAAINLVGLFINGFVVVSETVTSSGAEGTKFRIEILWLLLFLVGAGLLRRGRFARAMACVLGLLALVVPGLVLIYLLYFSKARYYFDKKDCSKCGSEKWANDEFPYQALRCRDCDSTFKINYLYQGVEAPECRGQKILGIALVILGVCLAILVGGAVYKVFSLKANVDRFSEQILNELSDNWEIESIENQINEEALHKFRKLDFSQTPLSKFGRLKATELGPINYKLRPNLSLYIQVQVLAHFEYEVALVSMTLLENEELKLQHLHFGKPPS